MYETWPN